MLKQNKIIEKLHSKKQYIEDKKKQKEFIRQQFFEGMKE